MKYVVFLSLIFNLIFAQARTLECSAKSQATGVEEILIAACEKLKESPQCQETYQRIRAEGNDPKSYQLNCTLEDLQKSPLTHGASVVNGCLIGGWNFVVDPIQAVSDGVNNAASFIAETTRRESEINRICDQSIDHKKKLFRAYNASVPQLMRLKEPSEKELARKSCALLKAHFIHDKQQKHLQLERTLSHKAFQKDPTFANPSEKEYVEWYKAQQGSFDVDASVLSLARKGLQEVDIRYECYNTTRATALVCQSLLNAGTGAYMVSRKVFELAGVQKLQTAQLKWFYRGEDSVHGKGVIYLNAEERARHQVSIKNGRVYDDKQKPFDTSEGETIVKGGGKGRAIFVMDRNGRIYVSNYQEKDIFHHSSLVGGEPVASAGEIEIIAGKIVRVTDRSGHYAPNQVMMEQFKSRLKELGVDTRSIQFEIKGRNQ